MDHIVHLSIVLLLLLATVVSLPSRALAANSTFANTTPIAIPHRGAASPYPSPIAVSGVTGSVTKVTVTLVNMNHTFTSDIDILLVGPTGQTLLLMSDTLGPADLNNTTLTFDDNAPQELSVFPTALSGAYRPTNYASDSFPAPAPGEPYGTTLSVFNSLNPNGDWRLYVYDDLTGDFGDIAGGWSLSLTTSDTTPPTISIASPADGAQYVLGQTIPADYSCADETALASCVGPVAHGAAINTSTVGNHSFTTTAQDGDGNTAERTHVYTVVYPFGGFFQPVDNPGSGSSPVFNKAKAGSAVPVKLSLGGNQGLDIFPAGSPASKRIDCDGSATIDPIEQTVTAGGSSLHYDATTDTYTYVWKTDKNWASTCRVLMVTLNDGTEHLAYFTFTK